MSSSTLLAEVDYLVFHVNKCSGHVAIGSNGFPDNTCITNGKSQVATSLVKVSRKRMPMHPEDNGPKLLPGIPGEINAEGQLSV